MSRSKHHRHPPYDVDATRKKYAAKAHDRERDDLDETRYSGRWYDDDPLDAEPRFECVIDESAGLAERRGS